MRKIMENYLKMGSAEFYKKVIVIMKKYENEIPDCKNYSFAARFAERRSANLVSDFYDILKRDNWRKLDTLHFFIKELLKMSVMSWNDGNIIFH